MKIAVQTEDFDVQAEVAALHASPKVGAVVMFLGTVRDLNEGDEVASMTLEHYPGMTEKALTAIVEEAKKRWDIMDATCPAARLRPAGCSPMPKACGCTAATITLPNSRLTGTAALPPCRTRPLRSTIL